MGFNPEYWESEQSDADQAFAELREAVYESVSDEITNKISRLTKENAELKERLENLDTLENEARVEKRVYEMKLGRLESEVRSELRRMEAEKILSFLTEEKYGIVWDSRAKPKCDKCNEDRVIPYTTPRGRKVSERCECSETINFYAVSPMMVKSVSGTGSGVTVWYEPTCRKDRRDRDDWDMRTRVLKPATSDEEMAQRPNDYGFDTMEEAQRVCDLANARREAERAKEEESGGW